MNNVQQIEYTYPGTTIARYFYKKYLKRIIMKTKSRVNRKTLSLNKISVTRLDDQMISQVKGGGEPIATEFLPQCPESLLIDITLSLVKSSLCFTF